MAHPCRVGVRFPSDLSFIAFGRDLLDWHVRRRLAGKPEVRFLEGYDVTGLLLDAAGFSVAGVRVRPRGESNKRNEGRLYASLVVDATGRSSHAPEWLEALGYPRPREVRVDAHTGYASRIYHRPSGFQIDWKMAFVQTAPPEITRGGLLLPIEGERWMLTLVGRDWDHPPTDEAGFIDFAKSLRSPIVHQAIKDAAPLTPISGYRATENRWRRYDRLSRQPHNFLVTGDAGCAFNPVYAQGMTIAALDAGALQECLLEQRYLDGDFVDLAPKVQKKVAGINSAPWMLATGEDLRVRGVEGAKPNAANRLMHCYMDRVLELSTKDPSVRLTLLETFNLIEPPTALFRPAIAAKVLRQAVSRRKKVGKTAIKDRLPRAARRAHEANDPSYRTTELRPGSARESESPCPAYSPRLESR